MTNKNEEIQEDTVETNEETMAGSSLKPAARSVSDPKALDGSKVSMMKSMLHMTSGMSKEDMTKWFDQAMALIGHEADKVGDNSGKNQSSIDMKTGSGPKTKDGMPKIASITPGQTMREDVEELFAGEDLTEEFKDKAATLFEAAVAVKALMINEELKEEYEAAFAAAVEEIDTQTNQKLDAYLDHVVEHWLAENEVAIESALRTEIINDLMTGMKNLFAEHYIDLPEDKVNVVEEMADKIDELEQKLDSMIEENNELKEELLGAQLVDVIEELASDLVLTQQEKFKSLAEEIDFDGDLPKFKKKLEIVKENYFKNGKPAESNIETESFEGDVVTEEVVVDPRVKSYVSAISRTVKK